MRLAEFIDQARAQIIAESVEYAQQIPMLSGEAIDVVRDHLHLVLDAIARDLEKPQTRAESIAKSQGRGPALAEDTAAQTHGLLRARSGLTVEQLVAEYRVLRSSVLRLWTEAHVPDKDAAVDTLRFNEAIDQAVAESVAFFAAELQRWRSIFLAALGHDLRGPLNAMLLAAEVLSHPSQPPKVASSAKVLLRSGRNMESLLESLLEYSKSELGMGMTLHRAKVDLALLCRDELEFLRVGVPGIRIDFQSKGDTVGEFDGARVREALANLIHNAAQHGSDGAPVSVTVTGEDRAVRISVENDTEPIPVEALQTLFEPLRRYRAGDDTSKGRNLGLGLFLVREIARAHGGDATASMVGDRVSFALLFPRMPPE